MKEGFKHGVSCIDCGIAGEENGIWKCFKYKYPVEEAGKIHQDRCPYFIKRILEDGEPLTPQQHLIMSEQELASRHLRGLV